MSSWERVVVSLLDVEKAVVPIGSRVLVSLATRHAGGHVVSMEIDHESLDALIGHFDAEGWIDCL